MLAVSGAAAAFVSDWFVAGLTPAIDSLGISQAFAGLVIVAVAGNAVENVVGIQLAARNRSDYALSTILQSPVQIALVLAPIAVLAAPAVGASFTLVLSPLLIAALVIAVVVTVIVVFDGESTWFEGLSLDRALRRDRDRLLVGLTRRRLAGWRNAGADDRAEHPRRPTSPGSAEEAERGRRRRLAARRRDGRPLRPQPDPRAAGRARACRRPPTCRSTAT